MLFLFVTPPKIKSWLFPLRGFIGPRPAPLDLTHNELFWLPLLFHIRIASLASGDVSVIDLLTTRRFKVVDKRRVRGESGVERLDQWMVEFLEQFGHMWECTRNHVSWTERDALDIGVLTTSSGKCRNIPPSYMAALLAEARSGVGTGVHGVAGMVQTIERQGTPTKMVAGADASRPRPCAPLYHTQPDRPPIVVRETVAST